MTEPKAGSALTELRSACTPDGDGFRLNGGKMSTSNTEDASVFLVYCRFGPGTDGIGSVLVERGMEGFALGAPSRYMNGETWCSLHFDAVFISASHILLREGGFRRQIAGFNVERIGNPTRALALGEYCFTQARTHAKTRRQFGRALAEFQGPQWKFAEMRVALDAARLLLYRAALSGDALPAHKPSRSRNTPATARASTQRTKACRSWAARVTARTCSSSTACARCAAG